jgi:ribosomal protein S18 acetylase RimI-like enzyme
MKYSIRKMLPSDYYQARRLWESTPGMKLEAADSKDGISRYILRHPELSYIAESDHRVIGTVIGGEDGRRGYLQHLCVAPEFRNQGIGKILLDASIKQFQKLDIHEVRIFVFKDNDVGNEFWHRLGWSLRDDIHVRTFNFD